MVPGILSALLLCWRHKDRRPNDKRQEPRHAVRVHSFIKDTSENNWRYQWPVRSSACSAKGHFFPSDSGFVLGKKWPSLARPAIWAVVWLDGGSSRLISSSDCQASLIDNDHPLVTKFSMYPNKGDLFSVDCLQVHPGQSTMYIINHTPVCVIKKDEMQINVGRS